MKREDAERLVDEAWKRALQPGWYVATKGDEVQCIHLRGSGLQQGDIMAGWTLGPSIAELLRDAARYRWVRDCGTAGLRAYNWDSLTTEQRDALIDAEIARERKAEGG